MKANGINAELTLFGNWIYEDETTLYFFKCSDCAHAWLGENKPELFDNLDDISNWDRSKRWCNHEEIEPIRILDKRTLDISNIIGALKGATDDQN